MAAIVRERYRTTWTERIVETLVFVAGGAFLGLMAAFVPAGLCMVLFGDPWSHPLLPGASWCFWPFLGLVAGAVGLPLLASRRTRVGGIVVRSCLAGIVVGTMTAVAIIFASRLVDLVGSVPRPAELQGLAAVTLPVLGGVVGVGVGLARARARRRPADCSALSPRS